MELKLVDTPVNPKHYHGKPCGKCSGTVRYKTSSHCVSCSTEASAVRRKKDIDKAKAYQRSWYKTNRPAVERKRLKYSYGITPEQYHAMQAQQAGKCAICGNAPKSLHIDHCHTSGHVRGLLCGSCNRALGLLKDCPDNFLRAIAYLNRPQKATNAA